MSGKLRVRYIAASDLDETIFSGLSVCLSVRKRGKCGYHDLSRNVGKYTLGYVRPEKIQISLHIRTVWSESSLGAFWISKDANFLHADNENSDQIARKRSLSCVFVFHTFLEGTFSRVMAHLFSNYWSSPIVGCPVMLTCRFLPNFKDCWHVPVEQWHVQIYSLYICVQVSDMLIVVLLANFCLVSWIFWFRETVTLIYLTIQRVIG